MALNRTSSSKDLDWVDEWRAIAVEINSSSTASQLTVECLNTFRKVLKQLSDNPKASRASFQSLKQSYSSLALWEAGYGIGQGKLDASLAQSRTLRESLLELLVSVSKTLTDRVLPLSNLGQVEEMTISYSGLVSITTDASKEVLQDADGDSGDESASDSSSVLFLDDWSEIAEDLSTDVQCILDLDPIIDCPAPDQARSNTTRDRGTIQWQPHISYSDKIKNRFPKAEASLVERLAQANWDRFLRTKASRENYLAAQKCAEKEVEMRGPLTEPVSKFHDSGLGTTAYSGTSYAETVMSYRANERDSIRIPPLPDGAKEGKKFDCLACGRRLIIKSNSAWKKHIYEDLCPWVCHDLGCKYDNNIFDDRSDWIDHLGLQHGMAPEWKGFECPLCSEDTGDGKFVISRHLSDHLEEISLAALPLSVEDENDEPSCGSDHLLSLSSFDSQVSEGEGEEPFTIKCICHGSEDDDSMIYCEACYTWQHMSCYYPHSREEAMQEDFSHFCADCKSRQPDPQETAPLRHENELLHGSQQDESGSRAASLDGNRVSSGRKRITIFVEPQATQEAANLADFDNDSSHSTDGGEPRYCYCNKASHGEMIACDSEDCSRQWFHLACVGLTTPPTASGKSEYLQSEARSNKMTSKKNGTAKLAKGA
ncbi:hypothetical protein S7711_01308 [Stachybotrys chartarum IBT 7711]|uniref:Zinc finger PHD-type domain-containing protein n=1 Tax=Stachybotrys chartarum (strain CBS 109288 / IBT 7711) TaxID=1280523 RepID=A0A084BBN1_STACB|nr:hypothetical protein S7711_01308 [Stachybotrys chartarum IBT 7711]